MKNNQSPLFLRARQLGLWSIINHWERFSDAPWLPELLSLEEAERTQRSLERRSKRAKLARFKPLVDFDWSWPATLDRFLIESLFSLDFIPSATNILLIGGHGTGKTMIAKNIAQHAVEKGFSALFVTANALLNDLAEHGVGTGFLKRLKYYARPDILVIDELGYLASTTTHADLLFHVVNERYLQKPIILTTNKPVTEWQDAFPGAPSIVGVVDRLIHQAVNISIEASSYRLKEAQERMKEKKTQERKNDTASRKKSTTPDNARAPLRSQE